LAWTLTIGQPETPNRPQGGLPNRRIADRNILPIPRNFGECCKPMTTRASIDYTNKARSLRQHLGRMYDGMQGLASCVMISVNVIE